MAAERRTERRWAGSEESAETSCPARRAGRGIALLAAGVCAGIGGLLALVLWGPDLPRVGPSPAASSPGPASGLGAPKQPSIPAGAPRPTPEQLLAEAKQLAEQLQATFPDNPQAIVLAGRIYYAFNDVTRANDCWQACVTRHPELAEARCAIAEAAWEHGDFEQAAEQLNQVFAANPKLDQKQVFFLADALMNLGRSPDAATMLERSAAQNPLPAFGLFLLAHAYLESGEHEQARQQFAAVLAANPQSANAHFGLATVCARLGQTEAARQHREQYAKLRKGELAESARLRPEMRKADWADPIPVVRESYLNAGKVCLAAGRVDEAERHWLRAAELDPQSPRPRQLLELLNAGRGKDER